jgi:hypothetical protein
LVGCFVLVVFVALLNTPTPSNRIAVVGRVVEVTPNVVGTVISIAGHPNVLVKAEGVCRIPMKEGPVGGLNIAVHESAPHFGNTDPFDEGRLRANGVRGTWSK